MARNDLSLYDPMQSQFTTGTPSLVAAGAIQSINRGEPVKGADAAAASPWTGAVAIMVDGDGTTSQRFAGIAKSDSSDTVAAAGSVDLWLPLPGLIYRGKAKTASTANTQALITALMYKRVVFDLTAAKWTVDAAAADASVNGVVIVGGEYQTSTLYFAVSTDCTVFT